MEGEVISAVEGIPLSEIIGGLLVVVEAMAVLFEQLIRVTDRSSEVANSGYGEKSELQIRWKTESIRNWASYQDMFVPWR
jgi:hypothetical protein